MVSERNPTKALPGRDARSADPHRARDQHPLTSLRRFALSHRTGLWVGGVLLGLLASLSFFSGIRLVQVASDLRRARDLINRANANIEQGQLSTARRDLTSAESSLTRANARLYDAPDLDAIGWLPIVSQNVGALRSSVGVALRLVHGGNSLLKLTQPLENARGNLEIPLRNGSIPLTVVQEARAQSQELAGLLPGVDERPSGALLLGPVADLRNVVYEQAARRRAQLDNLGRALLVLGDMAGGQGDRRYLVAVANPAEMRGSGGMILSYGVLESSGGTFKLGKFGNIDDLFLDSGVDPASLRLPADYLRRWGSLEPTRLWRNTTVNPDFLLDAPILQAMFIKKTGLGVDGVIQIDPNGLAAIMVGTGPVQVPGLGEVSAANVVDLTVNRAYTDYPDRDQRQEILGDVAEATFKQLVGGQLDSLRPLGDAVFQAASARHIMFYANSAAVEEQARYFKASGGLPPPDTTDYAVLTVQNFSKNKLDYYIDTAVALTGRRPAAQIGTVSATITIANRAPREGTASYVFGPNAAGEEAGLYRGTVSLYLPVGSSLVGAGGDPTSAPPVTVADGGRTVVTFGVELRPGEQRSVSLALALPPRPPGPYHLDLLPIGRLRPTVYTVSLDVGARDPVERGPAPLVKPETLPAPPARPLP